jgi:steroid delta-isomerase-like uncharacterized protein
MGNEWFGMMDPVAADSLTRRAALRRLGVGGLLAASVTLGPGRLRLTAEEAGEIEALPSVIKEWAAAWSAADLDRVMALYTDDAFFEEVPTNPGVHGKDEIRAAFAEALAVLSDARVTVTSGFQTGNRAAAEGTLSASYTGEIPGLPPGTGQAVLVRFAAILELEDDKIRRETDYFDFYSFLVQIGALPAPEETAES